MSTERDDDGLMLPPLDERRTLLDQLTALVKARGPAPLLVAPLVEPSARFFPDRWQAGEGSLRRLVRRLLGYAGLGQLRVEVVIYDADPSHRGEVLGKPSSPRGHDLVVWLAALERDLVKVGAESSAMIDPHTIVAAAARVVAHVYRRHFGLPTTDAFDPRIDLTGVYLGFGVLTADAALRYTTRTAAGPMQTRRTPARLGVLSPQSLCFLLAAQLHARGLPRAERQRIGKLLQANQAAFLRHAYAALDRAEPPVAAQLGLPAPEQWPPAPDLAALTIPFTDDPDAAPEARRDEEIGVAGVNAGKPVFRVERSMAARLGRTLGMGALMLGGVVAGMKGGLQLNAGTIPMIALGLGVSGLILGRFLRESRCSEPRCGASLAAGDQVCPRCRGDVVGVIHHPRERLAAEEAWRRAQPDAGEPEPAESAAPPAP
ncbi:hypothetical protein [Nannocystis bainbridge]|uniref:Uncharacterized protein n=1 Tax=Nannocystis bainbridge TaxID=2995303 RepID=A0ABT5DP58_9BACT|nr:hypothetical protein [Nannocystis bainbridge]MDC0715388.1 hypothetical protein [Nannocystis bainbridge]